MQLVPKANDKFTFADPEDRDLIVAEVLGRVARGETMASVCKSAHMPSAFAFIDWVAKDPELASMVARARMLGHDAIAERARQTLRGEKSPFGGESTGDVIRDKAIADLDLKLLSKWDRRYGDAVQLRHADADGEKLDVAPMVAEVMSLLRGPGEATGGD